MERLPPCLLCLAAVLLPGCLLPALGCRRSRARPHLETFVPLPPRQQTILTDINSSFHSSAGELQRLLPIQRKLTEVQNDVQARRGGGGAGPRGRAVCAAPRSADARCAARESPLHTRAFAAGQEVLDAIGDVVNDDTEVKKLCLSERAARVAAAAAAARAGEARLPPELGTSSGGRTPEMRMGSAILESYEFKLLGTSVRRAPLSSPRQPPLLLPLAARPATHASRLPPLPPNRRPSKKC